MFFRKLLNRQISAGAGFTLVEVLVAMSIFSIAVLGLAIGATTVMRANQTSLYSTIATNQAQDKLEELKSKTVANLPTCPSYATVGCSDTQTSSGVSFNRSWEILVGQPVTGVNQIDVKVSWTDYTSHSTTISSAVKQ